MKSENKTKRRFDMEKYRLSFCVVNKYRYNIAEIIVDSDIDVTIEMIEEIDLFLSNIFNDNFGVLVNKVNKYRYEYDARLMLGSLEAMKAVAAVNYSIDGEESTHAVLQVRCVDNLNVKSFSGYQLGWKEAFDWLELELQSYSLR